jgi:formylglycine-generating enzyme required for sulfatase activity
VSPEEQLIRPATFTPTRDDLHGRSWFGEHRVQLISTAVLLAVGWFVWFIFTAKSVQLTFDPPNASASISGGFDITLGGIFVLREGTYELHANAEGYETLVTPLNIGEARNQAYTFALTPLPGRIYFDTQPVPAEVWVDGVSIGTTPLKAVDVAAGERKVTFRNARYLPQEMTVTIDGKRAEQAFAATLVPNWGTVTLSSEPAGTTVFVDDQEIGVTPGDFQIVAGVHELRLKHPGFKSWRARLEVTATQDQTLPLIKLEAADGLVAIASKPAGAGVTVNGSYRGETPLEVPLTPGTRYDIRITRAGYETAKRQVQVKPNEEQSIQVELAALTGRVSIQAEPKTAEIFVDGISRGTGSQVLTLPAKPQTLEVKLPNYASYSARFTPQPGLTQEINVRLLTVAEARQQAMKPRVTAANGQTLVLLTPTDKFSMGSSRREPGRRANELIRDVTLTRPFYLSTTEVTNAQFRKFDPKHDTGVYEDQKLNNDDQPVAKVTWTEAALYCNALSRLDRLPPFYRTEGDKVVGVNKTATGYRLPTEAEWEWAARTMPGTSAEKRFPWGDDFPPKDRSGNYADRAAGHLVGRVIFGYNDNQIVSAPVATFPADARGLFDLGGNVSEWISDFYEIPKDTPTSDPMGPDTGEYHVIRGSSWMNGTITELRLTYRDYGTDGRPDLGFRIARFVE